MRLILTIIYFSFAALAFSCGEEPAVTEDKEAHRDSLPQKKKSDKKVEKVAAKTPTENKKRTPCTLPEGIWPQKLDMFSITKVINALPKPVTIPCVVDVLPRPLQINSTSSQLSVQPAVGHENPRVFIEIDWFLLSFALKGDGSKAIEFSEITDVGNSIKGEISSPVEKNLSETAAMDSILQEGGQGTICAGCHFNEGAVDENASYKVFKSKAIKPFERQNITIPELKSMTQKCANDQSLRCQILESFFRGDQEPEEYVFPDAMPTFF